MRRRSKFQGGGAILDLAARALRRADCGRLRPYRGTLRLQELLSFSARSRCDVPAAASNAKPAATFEASARVVLAAVSGEEGQHSSFLLARAAPRWLWST